MSFPSSHSVCDSKGAVDATVVPEVARGRDSPIANEHDAFIFDDGEASLDAPHKSTQSDLQAMQRMGRSQELVRHFRTLSMVSFVALSTSAWETNIFLFTQGLIDGGRPGVMYTLIWSFMGFIPIYLSMAEMASIAPIAGAQYHWVSEFAPESCQKLLSYLTGYGLSRTGNFLR